MGATVDRAADGASMIFRHTGRGINGAAAAAAIRLRTIQPPPNVRPRTRFANRPAPAYSILDRRANVFIWVISHVGSQIPAACRQSRLPFYHNGLPSG